MEHQKPVIAIVAEYNPFHLGHRYQIEEIRRRTDPWGIVVLLSTAFLQRGAPALLDKWVRAEMALRGGADLVIELPIPYCCHNAGVFASGAAALIDSMAIVGTLSFGMEEIPVNLKTIVSILCQEPIPFKGALKAFLDSGCSYAEARALAADRLCPGAASFLRQPNNTLAVAYAEALSRRRSAITLLPIQRRGGGYHSQAMDGPLPSAAAIRRSLEEGQIERAYEALPPPSAELLKEALSAGRCCFGWRPLWSAIRLLLLRSSAEELREFAEMGEGVEHRFLRAATGCNSLQELVEAVASRRYPRTRVQRQLIHFLLGLKHRQNREFQSRGPAYIRPLAMNRRGREMLKTLKGRSSMPVLSRAGDSADSYSRSMVQLEFRAARIWESLVANPDWDRELKARPVMI